MPSWQKLPGLLQRLDGNSNTISARCCADHSDAARGATGIEETEAETAAQVSSEDVPVGLHEESHSSCLGWMLGSHRREDSAASSSDSHFPRHGGKEGGRWEILRQSEQTPC